MFQLGDTLVSEDLLKEHFACDLSQCKGACCVEGEAGAPLSAEEVQQLTKDYDAIAPFLNEAGRKAIAAQGTSIVAKDKSLETPLVDGAACAYATFDERGWVHCGIEQAHQAGAVDWKKPISCHLYPVRVKDYSVFTAVNYHRWQICSAGCANGKQMQMPLYRFVAEALQKKFGADWFAELERVASKQNKNQ
ncbi:MAG: DUF3109 family protein [Bacteroidota bacterium]|nr:DUF3109 family protein [Bacteroidota bacterium]